MTDSRPPLFLVVVSEDLVPYVRVAEEVAQQFGSRMAVVRYVARCDTDGICEIRTERWSPGSSSFEPADPLDAAQIEPRLLGWFVHGRHDEVPGARPRASFRIAGAARAPWATLDAVQIGLTGQIALPISTAPVALSSVAGGGGSAPKVARLNVDLGKCVAVLTGACHGARHGLAFAFDAVPVVVAHDRKAVMDPSVVVPTWAALLRGLSYGMSVREAVVASHAAAADAPEGWGLLVATGPAASVVPLAI